MGPRVLTKDERAALIAEGYTPIEVWLPDIDNAAYKAEAKRQAQSAANADVEDRVMEWIEAVSADAWDDV